MGHSMVELGRHPGDWARPSYELAEQSIGFFEAMTWSRTARCTGTASRPMCVQATGTRLGTALFRWALAKGRTGYRRSDRPCR